MLADLVIAGVAVVFSLFFLFQASKIPQGRVVASLGASFWPSLMLGLLLFCAVVMALRALIKLRSKGPAVQRKQEAGNSDEGVGSTIAYPQNLWITLFLLGSYTYLMTIIGFVLATPLFIGVSSWLMGFKRVKMLAPITIILSFALIYLFPKTLYVPLPRGIGVFRSFSLLFY